jgi:hypothetical protein
MVCGSWLSGDLSFGLQHLPVRSKPRAKFSFGNYPEYHDGDRPALEAEPVIQKST